MTTCSWLEYIEAAELYRLPCQVGLLDFWCKSAGLFEQLIDQIYECAFAPELAAHVG